MTQTLVISVARLVLLAVVGYLLLVLLFAFRQRRLMYFPEKLTPEALAHELTLRGLEAWPAADEYRGVALAGDGARDYPAGTVMIFHGNATSAHRFDKLLPHLNRRGWRVLAAEYPGYAGRPGAPGENSITEDARASALLARQRHQGPLWLMGISLGTGVAAALANDPEIKPDGLVLISPFDSMSSLASHHYPWLPTRWLLLDHWNSAASLQGYGGAIRALVAGNDKVVPPAFTHKLLAPHPSARIVSLPEATHHDWFGLMTDREWDLLFGTPIHSGVKEQ